MSDFMDKAMEAEVNRRVDLKVSRYIAALKVAVIGAEGVSWSHVLEVKRLLSQEMTGLGRDDYWGDSILRILGYSLDELAEIINYWLEHNDGPPSGG